MAKTVTTNDLTEHLTTVLDEIAGGSEEITVTDHGLTVAKVIPLERLPRNALIGSLTFEGDITEPLDEDWDRES